MLPGAEQERFHIARQELPRLRGRVAELRERETRSTDLLIIALVGGILGSTFGVWIFKELRAIGQIDLVIRLSYVVFLGTSSATP